MRHALSSLILLSACTSASGRLDGEGVALRHAMFTLDSERHGELGELAILASGAAGCAGYTALDESLAAAPDEAGLAAAWSEDMPARFEELRIGVIVDGDLGDTALTLPPRDVAPTEVGEARAELIRYNAAPTDWPSPSTWTEAWQSDGGSLTLAYTGSGALEGDLDAPFVDGSGRDVGTLRIRIRAKPCDLGAVFEPDFRRW